MADDDVTIRLRTVGNAKTNRDLKKTAREVDNLGDQAKQAARKMRALNAESAKSRVSLGPFSTNLRFAALGVGGLALATGKASTALLGFAEATATAGGGLGAAGGVGLTALGQGMLTVKLATNGLSDALGGNEKALAKLNPAQARFVGQLQSMQPLLDTLRASASGGLLGGAGKGVTAASKNFGVLNKIVRNTSGTLGGLASKAGKGLGSKRAGKDIATMGATNVRIIDSLGNATLSLASAVGNVLVEAGPLAVWLADAAKKGAHLIDVWTGTARATGRMSDFFKRAKTNLSQLGSITGHTASGLVNLFGAKDVDGTKTLASLDRITARFEAWSRSPAVKGGVGQAIIDQIPKAAGGIASALARTMPRAAWMSANIFVKAFWNADVWGKAAIGAALALKFGPGLKKGLGGGGGGVLGNKPIPVFVTNPGAAGIGAAGVGKGGKVASIALTASTVFLAGAIAQPFLEKGVTTANKALNKPRQSKNKRVRGAGVGLENSELGKIIRGAGAIVKLRHLIPGFGGHAKGGTVTRSGSGLVGENGPELLNLQRGAKVIPLPAMGGVIHNVLMLDGRVVYEAYNRHNGKEKARH